MNKVTWKSRMCTTTMNLQGFSVVFVARISRKPSKIKEDKVPYNKEKTRLKLIEQEGWEENTKLLPTGWKMRSRPRPTQEGQLYFIFMSPEFQVFHSRKAMVQHMEDAGTYSKEDMFKVRQLAKPGPRPMNKPSLTNS